MLFIWINFPFGWIKNVDKYELIKKSSFKYKKHSLNSFIKPNVLSIELEFKLIKKFLFGKISLW